MGDFSAEKLFLFVLFALPGAIAIRVYFLWCPIQQKDWKESIFDAVLYSTVGLFVWLMLVPQVVQQFVSRVTPQSGSAVGEQAVAAVIENRGNLALFVFVTPALLSLLWYGLRFHVLHRWAGVDHPTRTAWDWVFSRRQPVYILFHLKDKDAKPAILVGYFNGRSFVTSYPLDAEIYVERVHTLSSECGVGPVVENTNGMLIKLSECQHLEFLNDPTPCPLPFRSRAWRWICDRWQWSAVRARQELSRLTREVETWQMRRAATAGRTAALPPPVTDGLAPLQKAQ